MAMAPPHVSCPSPYALDTAVLLLCVRIQESRRLFTRHRPMDRAELIELPGLMEGSTGLRAIDVSPAIAMERRAIHVARSIET